MRVAAEHFSTYLAKPNIPGSIKQELARTLAVLSSTISETKNPILESFKSRISEESNIDFIKALILELVSNNSSVHAELIIPLVQKALQSGISVDQVNTILECIEKIDTLSKRSSYH